MPLKLHVCIISNKNSRGRFLSSLSRLTEEHKKNRASSDKKKKHRQSRETKHLRKFDDGLNPHQTSKGLGIHLPLWETYLRNTVVLAASVQNSFG